MRCEDVEHRLDDRADGLLTPEQDRELEEHLESCADCRELAADLVAVGDEVRRLVDALPVRHGFAREVMEGANREDHRRRRSGLALVGAGVLTVAAAVLLLAVALRTPLAVRVTGTEGGLLRLDSGDTRWRGLREGQRVDAGTWVLTFPERRAKVDLAGAEVLLEGDVLAGLAPERIDLLHGRMLVTTGEGALRIVTPFGTVEGPGATVAVTIRYVGEPVFRVQADGSPGRVRSLLALASVSASGPPPEAGSAAGHVELAVLAGEVEWALDGGRGRASAGQRVRIGPSAAEGPSSPAVAEDWMTRPLAAMTDEDRALAVARDPVVLLVRALSSPAAVVRLLAADRLGRLCGGARAVTAVAQRLPEEDDAVVRRALLDALRRLDAADRAVDVLPSLRDPRPEVREAALRCWLDLKGTEGLERVGGMVDDPEPRLRVLALRGLRLLGDPGAREWAVKGLEDPDPGVAGEARLLLEALEGR